MVKKGFCTLWQHTGAARHEPQGWRSRYLAGAWAALEPLGKANFSYWTICWWRCQRRYQRRVWWSFFECFPTWKTLKELMKFLESAQKPCFCPSFAFWEFEGLSAFAWQPQTSKAYISHALLWIIETGHFCEGNGLPYEAEKHSTSGMGTKHQYIFSNFCRIWEGFPCFPIAVGSAKTYHFNNDVLFRHKIKWSGY